MSISDKSASPVAVPVDDQALPFAVSALDLRGRIVRLGPCLDEILNAHAYPPSVSRLLGEAVALTVLLGTALKFDGRFILQTRSDGPVRMLVVDYRTSGHLRAHAAFDRAAVAALEAGGTPAQAALLGNGHLAMTVDQGTAASRYQGLVELQGDLEAAAHGYFERSEQIPTRLRIAVAEEMVQGETGFVRRWRAGGILLQFLPRAPERARQPDLDPGDAPPDAPRHDVAEDDAWIEGRALVETVEDIELIDPSLASERVLYRLFHERGVRVFEPVAVAAQCSCQRESVVGMLNSFAEDDRASMVESGVITVTCEFCNTRYVVDPAEVGLPQK